MADITIKVLQPATSVDSRRWKRSKLMIGMDPNNVSEDALLHARCLA